MNDAPPAASQSVRHIAIIPVYAMRARHRLTRSRRLSRSSKQFANSVPAACRCACSCTEHDEPTRTRRRRRKSDTSRRSSIREPRLQCKELGRRASSCHAIPGLPLHYTSPGRTVVVDYHSPGRGSHRTIEAAAACDPNLIQHLSFASRASFETRRAFRDEALGRLIGASKNEVS